MKVANIFLIVGLMSALPLAAQRPPAQKMPVPLQAEATLERWERMTPEQRERALAKLPPERRIQVEERLRRLESMSAEDRQNLRQRYQEFQGLPQERRDALRLEIQALRAMRPMMRRRRVSSPEFQRLYSADEQRLLREAIGF
jgi:hypothetical protein